MHEFKKVMFENYFNMKGRASRREYWMFTLFAGILSIIIIIPVGVVFTRDSFAYEIVELILRLVFISPSLCLIVRRLHDIGKNGKWAFWLLVPLIGPIILLVFALKKSQAGSNEFGPSPLEQKKLAG